jgi:hypothetical protein
MPTHDQPRQHAGFTGASGGGADGRIGIGSVPEIGNDLEAATEELDGTLWA